MGDRDFASQLAKLVNSNGSDDGYYVNDAFATAHRAHASTTIVANYFNNEHKMFGYLMKNEMDNADRTLNNATKPFTAILGGAKVSDKILLIERLMDKIDHLIIGGAMTYTFFKSLGHIVGNSLVEHDKIEVARSIIVKARISNVNFLLPKDSVVSSRFDDNGETRVCNNTKIPEGFIGMDLGPQAIAECVPLIHRSKTILWNGTMGVYEFDNFANGTKKIGDAVVQATKNGGYSLVGGGDTVAAARKFDIIDHVSFASTGGGALLTYFEGKMLPGIEAIMNS